MNEISLNESVATAAIEDIKKGFSKIQNIMTFQFNVGFINPLSNSWGSPLAKQTVGKFCDNINKIVEDIKTQADNVVDAINSNASSFLGNEGKEWSPISHDFSYDKITNDKIGEKLPNGAVGILPDGATSCANQLSTLKSNLTEACSTICNAAGESGFSGSMGAALAESMGSITNKISQAFDGIDTGIKQAIKEEVAKAEDTSASVTQNFTGN